MDISNVEYLQAIFGEQYDQAHVTSFMEDPSNIPNDLRGRCWAGGLFKYTHLLPNSNQFFTVSLFKPDEHGKANRRKANFITCHVIALDDVKEKLPIEQASRLPPPSIVLKSSLHSEQWLYLLTEPCTDANMIDNLHDGLIKNGLAPDGKDPGQKGVTRYLRLPEGFNTKAKRIDENGGIAPPCQITEWHPDLRYMLDQLAEPFDVDLYSPRYEKRMTGAVTISDHPLLNTQAITIKRVISEGRFDITCPWLSEHSDADDSGSAVFTNSDGTIGFKCHHGSCEHLSGRNLLDFIEQFDDGFNNRLKHWQAMRAFNSVVPKSKVLTNNYSPLNELLGSCANGESTRLRTQMLYDKFILKGIAISGQWTVLYAGPNTGKTLLTLWMLKESVSANDIDGNKVLYANCDDTYKGGVQKLEIAEQSGFKMLLPNVKAFKADKLVATMEAMAESGEARDVVIVLDTLKKFTDLMDKRVASNFGNSARTFVSAGGTLICLAHVNKHKSAEGKSIYSGTADIRDDADCVYLIENLGISGENFTVEFECIKSRGAVAEKMAFQYSKNGSYVKLFNSVRRLNDKDTKLVYSSIKEAEQQSTDAEAIEAVNTALTNGICLKGEIVKFTTDRFGVSHRGIKHILDKYEGRLWNAHKGDNNSWIYTISEPPSLPRSFM